MRAQSVRKTVGIVNVLLVLGCAAAAAWYVLEVKPALAAGAKPKEWLDKANKQYEEDRKNVKPPNIFPLKEGELDVIRRPDLSTEAGVWSYVGPVPVPLPKKEKVAENTPPPPEGLDALGKPYLVIVGAGDKPSMVAWKLNSGKIGYFSEGEFIKEKGEKDRFKLIDVVLPDPKVMVVSLVYDVYDDPAKPPTARKTGGPYDLSRKFDAGKFFKPVPGAGAGAGGGGETGKPAGPVAPGAGPIAAPGTPPSVGPTPVPVPIEQVKPVIRRSGNVTEIEFDDAAWETVKNLTIEDVMGKVRTEDARDSKTNQPIGVRIADTGGVASAFDVQRGDILKSINGVPVHSRDEAVKVVKGLPKETTKVAVVVERNGTDRTYSVDPRDPKVRAAANKLRIGK